MITLRQRGDFSKTTAFLEKAKHVFNLSVLDKYGKLGVDALSSATPVDSGMTASCWRYETKISGNAMSVTFYNDNVVNGVPIAIILQYGHGTGTGGWVEGRDYINPAIQPVFDQLAEDVWKEVCSG